MKILISGASGFVGSQLSKHLKSEGHQIFHLVRRTEKNSSEIYWDPYHNNINVQRIEGFDSVIHLSGENVASSLWTSAKKNRLFKSRVRTTRYLVKKLGHLKNKPGQFICASGVGFYPDGGEGVITEDTPQGFGFFPLLCSKWESAAQKASVYGIQTLNLRMGMVLSRHGGAIKAMGKPIRWGLGTVLGSGDQYTSWIHMEDYLRLVDFCLRKKPTGIINATAPGATTLGKFTRLLARFLKRPVIFSLPELWVKLLMGEMGNELFLKSLRVKSLRLEELRFKFKFPDLESALKKEFPNRRIFS